MQQMADVAYNFVIQTITTHYLYSYHHRLRNKLFLRINIKSKRRVATHVNALNPILYLDRD